MKITPTTLTINQLFNNQSEQFFIPAYQRRYAWTWKQAKELFDDINNLNPGDQHLLGNIVCLTAPHSAGINKLEVVDGQQRITTLSLFLKAFQQIFNNQGDTDESDEIEKMLSSKGPDKVKKQKVLLGELDNPDYKKVLKQEDLKNIVNKNLQSNYLDLLSWLKALTAKEINTLHFNLINNVSVIRLDVYEAKDAYKLFETINNRGLSLNPTDIIKNFLLGHASYFDDEILEDVKANWKALIIALDDIKTDDFFRQFMNMKLTRKLTFTYLTDEFKKYYVNAVKDTHNLPEYKLYNKIKVQDEEVIEDEIEEAEAEENGEENGAPVEVDAKGEDEQVSLLSVVEFSKMLATYAQVYSKLRKRKWANSKINQALYNLQRIKSFPSYTFLLALFTTEIPDKDKLSILEMIATFMLRRHVCEYRTGELDNIFSKLVHALDEEDVLGEIKKSLLEDLPDDDEFKLKFQSVSFKGNINRAKYICEEVEYYLRGNTGELSVNSGKEVHLEHIIPQTITTKKSKRQFGDWEEYLGDKAAIRHPQYVNRIGNFTLLGQTLNIVASNNPFAEKLEEYKKSSLILTQNIVEHFTEFKFPEVEQRCEYFSDIGLKIWQL
jgi:uncharacterized protein with ParB-like and HNH nuclease domain